MGLAQYLKSDLAVRRARNPRYSLRAYARDLKIDHATLSQLLRGIRPLTGKLAAQLCDGLALDANERRLADEFDPFDAQLLAAAQNMKHPTSPSLAEELCVTADRVNVSVTRLARLGILTLEGDTWTTVRPLR